MTNNDFLPWHAGVWKKITQSRARLPHALLLQGRAGTGKLRFAQTLARSLLCDNPRPDQSACGSCDSCGWFLQDNHPDFRLLEPEERDAPAGDEAASGKGGRKTQIAVDQVRALADFLALSSHRSGLRLVLLHPAEALNPASANALLKMLEEPPPAVVFLLVTHQPQRLLPTIRSRCSKIDMPMPTRDQAEAWLAGQGLADAAERLDFAGGAPLLAQALEDEARALRGLAALLSRPEHLDPMSASPGIGKDGVPALIDGLQKWCCDLLSERLAHQVRYYGAHAAALQDLAKGVDLAALLDFQRVLNEARSLAMHPLNADLLIESLMIQYTQLFMQTSKP